MSQITSDVDIIINQLQSGNVVALPTETVYGLAADATNDHAVEKIFKIKNRPLNHPLIMHVCPDWDLTQWVDTIPQYAVSLMKAFWPGPLTFVFRLNKMANISPLTTGHQDTIAIRSPAHPSTLNILSRFGKPVVAPSANPFGRVSPTEAQHVMQDFPEHSFSILEGGCCDVGIESTILNCVDEGKCSILRHGSITQSEIQAFCDVLQINHHDHTIRVSGNLKTHYQPKKKLFYFNFEDISRIQAASINTSQTYILSFSSLIGQEKINYLFPSCPKQAAKEFYRQLRIADQSSKHHILIQLPPNQPEWSALIERIKKAGTLFE